MGCRLCGLFLGFERLKGLRFWIEIFRVWGFRISRHLEFRGRDVGTRFLLATKMNQNAEDAASSSAMI